MPAGVRTVGGARMKNEQLPLRRVGVIGAAAVAGGDLAHFEIVGVAAEAGGGVAFGPEGEGDFAVGGAKFISR